VVNELHASKSFANLDAGFGVQLMILALLECANVLCGFPCDCRICDAFLVASLLKIVVYPWKMLVHDNVFVMIF
jgi:hypothetical protein